MSDPIPFSFQPNWSEPITERLSWLTAVMQSRSGAEQRQALRLTPRRQFDISVMPYGQERSYFDAILARNGGGTWNVPIPHEEINVGSVAAGQTTFYFPTAYRELSVGTKLLVRGSWSRSEIVEVTSMEDTSVTTTPTVLAYDAASLTPTFVGVISDVVTASRPTARVYTATVRFTSLEAAFWPSYVPPVYTPFGYIVQAVGDNASFPFWSIPPNAVNELDYGYERSWSVVDGDTSLPVYVDKAKRQFTSQKYEFFLVGSKERQDFRNMLYALRGKLYPVWMPTFNDDLADTYFSYPDPLGLGAALAPGREWCVRFKLDGTPELVGPDPSIVRMRAVGSFAGVPPEQYSGSSFSRSCFVSLKRLDVDDIEIQHYATLDGVATCSVLFRDAPYLRREGAQDVAPQTYPDAIYHHGGGSSGDEIPTNDVSADAPTIAQLVASQTILTTS